MAGNVSPGHTGVSELNATQQDGKARSAAMSVLYVLRQCGWIRASVSESKHSLQPQR